MDRGDGTDSTDAASGYLMTTAGPVPVPLRRVAVHDHDPTGHTGETTGETTLGIMNDTDGRTDQGKEERKEEHNLAAVCVLAMHH